ncbi:MAG: N-acetylmuramoyl-L-alanine amidase [bacterium]|nr:MAG: N-acetylmuramoyl-L-alanine amidase [bacterium]
MLIKIKQFWLLLLLAASFIGANSILAQIKIEVIYPKEGSRVTASESTFIFGNVSPVRVEFTVNNVPTQIYPNGAFLTVVPVESGDFSFVCQAVSNGDTARLVRNVYIPYYLRTSPSDSLVIDTSYIFPVEDWELQPEDVFKVAVKGTPGCQATFSIEGLVHNLPMAEIPPKKSFYWGEAVFGQGTNSQMPDVRGIYTGAYIIQSWDWAMNRQIRFKLADKAGNIVQTLAPGRLSIDNSAIPRIARLSQEVTIAQTGPRLGYQLFLPEGVKVWITGHRGDYLRARLSETDEVWIKDENAEILPLGTPLPEGVVTVIRTQRFEKKTRVKIFLDQRLPFKVEQVVKPPTLLVTLYGVTANTDWIKLDFTDPLIREIRWEQKARGVYQIKIDLDQQQHWGYHPFYEDGNFYIDIKKKPNIHGWFSSPLKDIIICLDPGHSPELGAVGPRGFTEKEMNYKYCVALKKELENKGAFVVLTHGEKDGASLKARTQLATFVEADILLSLHFNALPDGVDPFKNHGISTYYYHPQSYRLAYLIQKMLLKHTGLKNFGLFYDNLAMCRPPQMIAVLTEPGFIMHPWEEILITSESYQEKVVNAIVKALEQFLKESK